MKKTLNIKKIEEEKDKIISIRNNRRQMKQLKNKYCFDDFFHCIQYD